MRKRQKKMAVKKNLILFINITLQQLYDYVTTVDIEEIRFINEAYKVNLELFHEGLENPRTTFARQLLAINNGKEVSDDEQKTASLMC